MSITDTPIAPPLRGDAFEQWLESQRDGISRGGDRWITLLDDLICAYRCYADTGTPLGQPFPPDADIDAARPARRRRIWVDGQAQVWIDADTEDGIEYVSEVTSATMPDGSDNSGGWDELQQVQARHGLRQIGVTR